MVFCRLSAITVLPSAAAGYERLRPFPVGNERKRRWVNCSDAFAAVGAAFFATVVLVMVSFRRRRDSVLSIMALLTSASTRKPSRPDGDRHGMWEASQFDAQNAITLSRTCNFSYFVRWASWLSGPEMPHKHACCIATP